MHPVQTRQDANPHTITWPVAGQISHHSAAFELRPENLIHPRTPGGAGPVVPSGVTERRMDGFPAIRVRVAAA